MSARYSAVRPGNDDVAIIGMACLFPGARDLDAYWQNILDKVDAVTDPPQEAWDPAVYYAPGSTATDRIYCKKGGFLAPLAQFDPLEYGIMPIAIDGGEPDQWLALKAAYDALRDADYLERLEANPEERSRTGVILGKGTYLNRGNLNMVQHSLVVEQTVQVLRSLHPEYGEGELQQLREELKRTLPPFNADSAPGLVPNITAGRIANRLDLMGPAYTVDAACASSLIALEHAVRELNSGNCDLVLAGGVQVTTPMPILALFSQLGALSRREEIRPFDKNADGTILSEGLGIVVLKRRQDAERDGDRIYAVIKAVGSSSDGRGTSVLTPRLEGEVLALRRALELAEVEPTTIGLIEAHGTGTPVGDQVEIQALRTVFGERGGGLPYCALGTVKSMIGHTMPAAGIAGVIKAALALYHKVLPPTIHVDEAAPNLELERSPFYLNTEVRPWIHGLADTPRRAGVNAFGFGGINAHVLLEEVSDAGESLLSQQRPAHLPKWENELIVLAATSRAELMEKLRELLAFCHDNETASLADLAYTVTSRTAATIKAAPDRQSCRIALVATSIPVLAQNVSQALMRLEKAETRQIRDIRGIYYFAQPFYPQGKLAFLFPGEGAQYPHMLADLCLHFPEVRACFDRIDRLFVDHPRGFRPSDLIFPHPHFAGQNEDTGDKLWQIDGAIEAVLTANMALSTLLNHLGVRPDVCVGHSTGEYSALLAAGAIAESDQFVERYLLDLNRRYVELTSDTTNGIDAPRATMAAIGTGIEQIMQILATVTTDDSADGQGQIYIGMDNCPHQTVVLGDRSAIDRVLAIAQAQGIITEILPFDRGYHSPLFAPYNHLFRELYDRLPLTIPHIPVYSCVTAAPFPEDVNEIRRLATENWVNRVRFRETVEAMYQDDVRIFVEVGPRGNLTAFVGDILRGQPHLALSANIQQRSGLSHLNHLLAILSAQHISINFDYYYRRRNLHLIEEYPNRQSKDAARSKKNEHRLATGWAGMTLSPDAIQRIRNSVMHKEQSVSKSTLHRNGTVARTTAEWSPDVYVSDGGHSYPAMEQSTMLNHHFQTVESRDTALLDPMPPASQQTTMNDLIHHELLLPAVPDPPQGDLHRDRSLVVEGHLRLMEQFLQTQETVMRLYLQGAVTESVEPVPIPSRERQIMRARPEVNGHGPTPAPTPVAPPQLPPSPQWSKPEYSQTASNALPQNGSEQTKPAQIKEVLLRLVSERTGYPEEMIDLTANLEADLGIDSIKRVEILGAFNRETKLLNPADIERVSALKTLGAMIDFFQNGSPTT